MANHPLAIDPCPVVGEGFVQKYVGGLRVLAPELLLVPVTDVVVVQPQLEPLLALPAPLGLDLGTIGGVDGVLPDDLPTWISTGLTPRLISMRLNTRLLTLASQRGRGMTLPPQPIDVTACSHAAPVNGTVRETPRPARRRAG